MNKYDEDHFQVLRKIQKKPDTSQRELAGELGFSLGKLNYCLNALIDKGLIKINNFKKKRNKAQHIKYIITPRVNHRKNKFDDQFHEKKDERIRRVKKRT